MPHAQIENVISCCAPECVQPGTSEIPVSVDDRGQVIVIDVCEKHAQRWHH